MYYEKQDYDSAVINYDKALSINPTFTNALYSMGAAQIKKGNYKQAIDNLTQCISIDPDFESAYQQLTYAYFLDKNYNKSWEYLNIMKSKRYPLDNKFIEQLQKESGRRN